MQMISILTDNNDKASINEKKSSSKVRNEENAINANQTNYDYYQGFGKS